jgi:hypothetical protein
MDTKYYVEQYSVATARWTQLGPTFNTRAEAQQYGQDFTARMLRDDLTVPSIGIVEIEVVTRTLLMIEFLPYGTADWIRCSDEAFELSEMGAAAASVERMLRREMYSGSTEDNRTTTAYRIVHVTITD